MREILISPRARRDLIEVWLYTFENWGEAQADSYVGALERHIDELAEAPNRGRSREPVREGYWSIHVGRHVVFYTFTDSTVKVRRVLHDQMDVDRHL